MFTVLMTAKAKGDIEPTGSLRSPYRGDLPTVTADNSETWVAVEKTVDITLNVQSRSDSYNLVTFTPILEKFAAANCPGTVIGSFRVLQFVDENNVVHKL